jgi:hypothetical protein
LILPFGTPFQIKARNSWPEALQPNIIIALLGCPEMHMISFLMSCINLLDNITFPDSKSRIIVVRISAAPNRILIGADDHLCNAASTD